MSDTRKSSMSDETGREARSSSLDLTDDEMRELAERSVSLVMDYFAHVCGDKRVFPNISADTMTKSLSRPLPVEGEPIEHIFDLCRVIIEASRHNGHPRFFGYVASPSTPVGAFADLIASTLNQNVTSWRSAPAATEIEKTVVRWLAMLIGYGEEAHGLLTSGGSMANLNALYIAHRAKSKGSASRAGLWNAGAPMTIYVSDQVHLSIPKAADVLGLGRDQVRVLESDERFRLDVRSLRERLEVDARARLRPFCVVASAGTVNTGAVDPLADIARIANEYDLWFHVDGAYGAPGALDERKRALFAGLELADSVSLDAHKWLYAPIDCGCLLFHDARHARDAFISSSEADYIKVHEETDAESFAFWDYGIELSRRFRALKIWMMLCYYGARRMSDAISEDNHLAEYFAEAVNAAEDFELLAPVELSICCFRYVPPQTRNALASANDEERARINLELDELNARLGHEVQRGGQAYLSNATLKGRNALRACIVNYRTTRADITKTLDIIRDAAHEISKAQ